MRRGRGRRRVIRRRWRLHQRRCLLLLLLLRYMQSGHGCPARRANEFHFVRGMSMRVCDSHVLWCGVVCGMMATFARLIGADDGGSCFPLRRIPKARCCAGECCIHKQLASCTSTQAGNRAMTALTRVGEVELLVLRATACARDTAHISPKAEHRTPGISIKKRFAAVPTLLLVSSISCPK